MKNILAASILLSVFIIAVFSYPYIVYWLHTNEATHTAKVITTVGVIIIGICLYAVNTDIRYRETKDKEFIEDAADNFQYRKSEIKELAKTGKIDIKV